MSCYLYRLAAADGELLYIGISDRWTRRMGQHEASKSWFGDVASVSVQRFETREDALTAERNAIRSERPRHNVTHAPALAEPPPPEGADAWLMPWECDDCERRVDHHDYHGGGAIVLMRSEYRAWQVARRERREFERQRKAETGLSFVVYNGNEIRKFERRMKWHVWCNACCVKRYVGEDDEADLPAHYWIPLDEIETPAEFMERTAHLHESKGWFAQTQWDLIAHRFAAALRTGKDPRW